MAFANLRVLRGLHAISSFKCVSVLPRSKKSNVAKIRGVVFPLLKNTLFCVIGSPAGHFFPFLEYF